MPGVFQFSDYVLDAGEFQLRRGERTLKLEKLPMELLILLVERKGTLVSREEIIERIWGKDVFFESDSGINTAVSKLRQALGDDAESPKYIQTVVGKGYRFIASVNQSPTNGEGTNLPAIIPIVPASAAPGAQHLPRRRRWIAVLVVVLLLGLGVGYYVRRTQSLQTPQTLAVLPFKPLSTGPGDESLELGMADTLITKLSRSARLIVRPTSAIRKYTGADSDPLAAGRALQVDTVLEGYLQRVDERLRVSLRLIRVRDGVSLWADSYDTRFTDMFQVQDTVSERVVDALGVQLSSLEKAGLRKRDTANVEAYELCMRGVFFFNTRSEDGLRKAVPYFEQAIAADNNYALAYAELAAALGPIGYLGYRASDEIRPKMRDAAMRAVALDPNLPLAHVVLGAVLAFYEWTWSEGEKEFQRALQLDRNLPLAHLWYGLLLECNGRYEDALKQWEQAQELDPVTPVIVAAVGVARFRLGDNEGALQQFRKALEVDDTFDQGHVDIGHVYERSGDYRHAIAEYRLAVEHSPKSRLAKTALGYALARAGETAEAKHILDELLRASQTEYVSPVHLAIICAGLDDNDAAMRWLEKAHDQRNATLSAILSEPDLQGLHGDPRFKELSQSIGLVQQ